MPDQAGLSLFPFRKSIASRLAVMLVAATSLVLALAGTLAFWFQYRQAQGQILQATVVNANQFSEALSLPLGNAQPEVVNHLLDSLMEDRSAAGVIVRPSGAVGTGGFARSRDSQWHPVVGTPSLAGKVFVETRNVAYDGKVIGTLQVVGSSRWINADIWRMFAWFLGLILLLDAVLVTLLYLLLHRNIVRPVQAIGRFADRVIATGAETAQAPQGRFHGELDGLRLSIETMVRLLQVRYAQLKSNEARFRTLIEEGPTAIGVSRDEKLVYGNQKFMALFGFQGPDEFSGKSLGGLLAPEVRDEILERSRKRSRGEPVPAEYETIGRRKDNSEFPLRVAVSMVELPDGPATMVFLTDITGQIQAQQTQRRLASILEQTPDGVIVTDLGGVVTEWNRGAERMFGYSAKEAVGLFGFLLEPGEQPGETGERRKAFLGGQDIKQYETARKRKDGKLIHLSVSASVLRDHLGQPVGYAAIYRDITPEKEGQKTQRLLASILEQTSDAVLVADLEGNIIEWNKGAEILFGYKAEEALDKPGSFLDPDLQPGAVGQKRQLLHDTGTAQTYDAVRKGKNGRLIQVEITSGPLKDLSGRIVGYSAIYRDISGKLEAQESQRLLASILEQTPDGVILSDLDGVIRQWNKGAEAIYGYAAGEIVGKSGSLLEAPGHEGEIEATRRKMLRDGLDSVSYESVRKRKDGRLVDVSATRFTVEDKNGKTVGFAAIVRDITERKKIENNLAESEERFRHIFEDSPLGMAIVAKDSKLILVNRRFGEITGYTPDEMKGKSFADFTHPDEAGLDLGLFRRMVEGEFPTYQIEKRFIHKDGREVWVHRVASLVRDKEGKPLYGLGMLMDIDDKKKAEESLRQQEERMRQLDKMNAIGRLAGGVAHDFNNLLSVVGGNAEFLKGNLEPGSPHREEVEEIQKAVLRGSDLTRQMLVFSKKQATQPQPVDLNRSIADIHKMLTRTFDANIELFLQPGKDLWLVQSDPGQVHQAVMNLGLNARDAMPKGGHLILETRNIPAASLGEEQRPDLPPGDYVRLKVVDTGTGMPPEVQKHVFEPFFTTKAEKGTGLGLANVFGIVANWNGSIYLESELGRGTTFTLYWPALTGAEAAGVKERETTPVPRGTETVLLAEDEDALRRLLVRALEKQGYRVLEADNGTQAVVRAMAFQDPIHLLVTDVIMPKMNGKELAEELANSRPETKVIYISGYPREVLSQQNLQDPNIRVIQKPFQMEDFLRTVRKVLDEA